MARGSQLRGEGRHLGRTTSAGRSTTPGFLDTLLVYRAVWVARRHPSGGHRRDRPQLSCQSACQQRSPRPRSGGYLGWGVQESNLRPLACRPATLGPPVESETHRATQGRSWSAPSTGSAGPTSRTSFRAPLLVPGHMRSAFACNQRISIQASAGDVRHVSGWVGAIVDCRLDASLELRITTTLVAHHRVGQRTAAGSPHPRRRC